jgi:hypothetical protein
MLIQPECLIYSMALRHILLAAISRQKRQVIFSGITFDINVGILATRNKIIMGVSLRLNIRRLFRIYRDKDYHSNGRIFNNI